MHLAKVEVTNFRSFKNLTVNLQPGLNVIVGRNNIGKTNLLDAIRHAIGRAGARGETLWLSDDDFYRTSTVGTKAAETISITLTFESLSDAQRAHFYEIVDFNVADLSKSKAILHFDATWPEGKRQTIDRWGGGQSADRTPVSAQILESLSVTYLPALRDAEAALAPGGKSRLAQLLKDMIKRAVGTTKTDIENIFRTANQELEAQQLISSVTTSLQKTTMSIAGTDYAPSAIRASGVELDRILRTLRVQMENGPIDDLSANGLGYNNLLYMAVILEHLKVPDADECPLLLVEEPEAHLHPQLTMLLAEYLANQVPGGKTPQTIVTTHSPTLAASIPPSRVHALFTDTSKNVSRCNSIAKAGMDEAEEMALQRMLDITRATLYFAKGVILVEGISESLLLPVLAKRLNHDLAKLHVSVIPICGVAFETFRKLLHPDALGIPAVFITDADPPVKKGATWEEDQPEIENEVFTICDRTAGLVQLFNNHNTVKVFHSQVTLEYDLADAGDLNASLIADVWKDCFKGSPGTFNSQRLDAVGNDRRDKALCTWRGICRASHSGSKAEFAQRLATRLEQSAKNGKPEVPFEVPQYIKDAIEFVVSKVKLPAQSDEIGGK